MITSDTYTVPCPGLCPGGAGSPASPARDLPPLTVRVPGSKSITNRALLLAMLADGESTLSGVLYSDDSRHFLNCLESLGFETVSRESARQVSVVGLGGRMAKKEASLYVGSAGTAARFLTAVLGVSEGVFYMDASDQMKRRPMAPLLRSLSELGCGIRFSEKEGFFPFTLNGRGFGRQKISIDIAASSQFLSALLVAAVLSPSDFTIQVEGTHGMAYIEMTCRMMEQFGVTVLRPSADSFLVPAGQSYRPRRYEIEPDASAAAYFYAMAAVLGISVIVPGIRKGSLQGDVAFLSILEKMGCSLRETADGLCLSGPADGQLKGITADMSACSDQAITLSAIAPYADGPVTITGVAHIREQESDRLSAIAENLRAMGIVCEERQDGITIRPGSPRPAHIKTHDDHRLAMGFSLTGLRAEGIVIENPSCCRKTFEDYFEVFEDALSRLMP